jgi:CheY-like chemotaxis protein
MVCIKSDSPSAQVEDRTEPEPNFCRMLAMKKLRVMIVEDDSLIAELLAELIQAFGHEVCAIETGESGAVAAAAREKPDLMIVDANLQEGSGIGAIETILAFGPMPHILVSGDANSVRTLRPLSTVLQKPYFEVDLILAIQKALGASETP